MNISSLPIIVVQSPCIKYLHHSKPGARISRDRSFIRMLNSKNRSIPMASANLSNETAQENPWHQIYLECIKDLNSLQSNTQTLALSKYKNPKEIMPLFTKQMRLAGIEIDDLGKLKIIHVSGTKGKGSTCAFTDSILRASGKRIGFYNSPHLVKVTERIRIDGKPIDDEKFSVYFRQVFNRLVEGTRELSISMPSYFSFLTILAFHVFIVERVDGAIIEVGIGGEYDPTNVIPKPVACGITTLDLDHTDILGHTIEDIAWSKAGICKPGVPIYTVEQQYSGAIDMIKSRALEKGSPLYICQDLEMDSSLTLGIRGSAQYRNAALACQLAGSFLKLDSNLSSNGRLRDANNVVKSDLNLMPSYFRDALESCNWPGRCQVLRFSKVTYFLDGAHTSGSMQNCLEWFIQGSELSSPDAIRILLINIIGTRDKRCVLKPLSKYRNFRHVLFTSNKISSKEETQKSEKFFARQNNSDKNMENSLKISSIWLDLLGQSSDESCENLVMANITDSIDKIKQISMNDPEREVHVLVTGSLHLVGAMLEALTVE